MAERAQRALTVEEIAALTRAKPRAGDPLDRRISNIAPLDTAVAADISFLDKPKFLDALAVTRAGACFVSPRFEAQAPRGLAVLEQISTGLNWYFPGCLDEGI